MSESKYKVTYGSITNQGERKCNEDSLGAAFNDNWEAFILCDGLGGHGNGDVASSFVVEQMQKCLSKMSLEESVLYAQQELLKKQQRENEEDSMKTTLTCLLLQGDKGHMIHVGDSRIYLFRKGKYQFRTQDHSVPQMLFERGDIKEKDIRHHEDRSRLLRVMGTQWTSPKYQTNKNIKLDNHTSFLLCSDGFWELIDEKQMEKTLRKSKSPEEWLAMMEKIIWQNGRGTNMDNYSAIAIFLSRKED